MEKSRQWNLDVLLGYLDSGLSGTGKICQSSIIADDFLELDFSPSDLSVLLQRNRWVSHPKGGGGGGFASAENLSGQKKTHKK